MIKLQALFVLSIVSALTAVIASSSGTDDEATTVPASEKPRPTRAEGECGVKPEWIHRLFARYHNGTGLRMNCRYNTEAYWAAIPFLNRDVNTVNKDFWCRITHKENRWGFQFNEKLIESFLKSFFTEKISLIAQTYPGTEYGCTAMHNKYYGLFTNLALCIYSRRPYENGTLAPCPKGTE
ncbi:hypothetical protein Q1695_016310 [Nippostrongylus brasiliensis]|nr:hypothetical protein Q1695_016310 [Nippostrongylus brasiliensis]